MLTQFCKKVELACENQVFFSPLFYPLVFCRPTIETNDERSFINVFIPVHEGCGDTVELNVSKDDPKDDPKKLTERQQLILDVLRESPQLTRVELTQRTGFSDSTIKRELSELKDKGYIYREGGKTYGHWVVNNM